MRGGRGLRTAGGRRTVARSAPDARLGRVARLGLLAALALPAACGESAPPREAGATAAETPRRGGTAVLAGRAGPTTLNPLVSSDYVASQLAKHVLFAPLVRYDSQYVERPWLAASWETSRDSTEVVFRLREGARWHDGEPVTAEDVAFTFRRLKDPEVPFPNRTYFDGWREVEVVDPLTVRFELEPHAGYLFGWTQTPILPAHVLEGTPPAELATHPFGTRPVGNGPFRFAGREGDRWSFDAVEEFPEAMGGPPLLEGLVFREIPDETTLLAELRTGNVHFYMDVPPGQLARARALDGVEVETYPARTYAFIAWNTRLPRFEDPAVRRALTMAIDRRAIVEAVRNGLGVVASGPVGPWHWAHDPDAPTLPYSPDSARALLERAGWRDADGDGVRERDGARFAFELATSENRVREDIAVIVQDHLARVGVEARPRIRDAASLAGAVTSPARDFEAVVLAWDQDRELDDRDLWACGRMDQPFQFTGYCDPRLDAVLDSIPLPQGRPERARLYRRYDEIVRRDQPYTFLYFETVADAWRRILRGVGVDARGELAGVGRWWLASAPVAATAR